MTLEFERRTLLQMLGLGVVGGTALGESWPAFAQGKDTVTIGWPSDVPSWDPNQRFAPDAQSIFKLVFDTAIDQGPDLKYIPRLVSKWELAADGSYKRAAGKKERDSFAAIHKLVEKLERDRRREAAGTTDETPVFRPITKPR